MRNDFVKWVKQAVLITAVALFALSLACRSTQQNLNKPPEQASQPATQPTQSPFEVVESKVIEDNSPFDHARPEHQTKTKDCIACHQRTDNDPMPKFPGHAACIECHQKDFTNVASKMCEVCHKVPVDRTGTLISFPSKQFEFGIKAFPHKLHMDPEKMKDQKAKGGGPRCDDCHRFDGAGVQASFPKHPDCYSCHAHEAGGKLANCDVCHVPKAQAVKYSAGMGEAFSLYNFKHGSHIRKAECERCHKPVNVPEGQARSDMQQINISRGQRHNSSCWDCHVQAREPVCTKCHIASRPF